MKIFLAIPFSQFCNNTEEELIENRWFFLELINKVKELGLDYFLAHEREEWGAKYVSAKESTVIDYDAMQSSDLIVAIPGNPISGGVHMELGWATSLRKKILIFLDKSHEYSPMIEGACGLTDVKYFYYDEMISKELINLIVDNLKKEI